MAKVTWLGDGDPEAEAITLFGHDFPKGKAVEVKDEKIVEKLSGNPLFTVAGQKAAD